MCIDRKGLYEKMENRTVGRSNILRDTTGFQCRWASDAGAFRPCEINRLHIVEKRFAAEIPY